MAYVPGAIAIDTNWTPPEAITGSTAIAKTDDIIWSIITTNPASLQNFVNTQLAKIVPYMQAEFTKINTEIVDDMTLAKNYATAAENVAVAGTVTTTTDYSSKHYSIKTKALYDTTVPLASDVATKHTDFVPKYNDFADAAIGKYPDFLVKYGDFTPKYTDFAGKYGDFTTKYSTFVARYMGALATNPTSGMVTGSLYFNTTANVMMQYDATNNWVSSYTAGSSNVLWTDIPTVSSTELSYLDGVTSSIQAQINGKEPSFVKNTAFNKNFGSTAGTVADGADARLSNSRRCDNSFDNASTAKSNIGLGNVDNTSDVDKPVSTDQQNALNLKAPLVSPAFAGAPTAPTPALTANNSVIPTTAFVKSASLGWGQVYQDVTGIGGRVNGATIQNTSGKPIVVNVTGVVTAAGLSYVNVGDTTTTMLEVYRLSIGSSSGNGTMVAIVPPLHWITVYFIGALTKWNELR